MRTIKPVHNMTEREWEELSDSVKFGYPHHEGGAGPSHNNYYICCLHLYIQLGGTLKEEVWNKLDKTYQDHLTWVMQKG